MTGRRERSGPGLLFIVFVVGLIAQCRVAAQTANRNPDAVIAAARKAAAEFAQAAPDYIVKRTIYRYRGVRREWAETAEGINLWQPLDTISANLTLDHKHEVYTNLMVNGFPATDMPSGVSTSGELSTEPLMILAPEAAAIFTKPKRDTVEKHHTYRFDFSVDQAHSTWHLDVGRLPGSAVGASCTPAFAGRIWIDIETNETIRIEASTRSVPKGFPLDWAQLKTDYDYVKISDKNYTLPVQSEAYACMAQPEKLHDLACYWNESLFQGYDKFSVDSNMKFDAVGK